MNEHEHPTTVDPQSGETYCPTCHLHLSPDTAYERALAEARRLGAERGTSAASWYTIGGADFAQAILEGIEDSDPRVLDTFPSCDLSGQWADSHSGPDVIRELLGERTEESNSDDDTALLDAYEEAYNTAVQDEIERMARWGQLGPTDPTGRYIESSLHGPDGWCGETRPHTHGLSEGIITYTDGKPA
jgi:hypothetical protein